MEPFWVALLLIGLSEFGDKTQLLTLGFAARFPFFEVAGAIVLATVILHFLAVVFGSFMGSAIEPVYINLICGCLFVAFGIWAAVPRGDNQEDSKFKLPPFWLIFVSFFLAEFGDKSQLATAALAMKYNAPISVFLGAVLGMGSVAVAGAWVGSWLKNKAAERTVNLLSAALFIIFGVLTIIQPLF
ncbi:MAG: TMEM165/GDT1 family protein [Candidatus Margulisiibacteriota bacterium]